MSSLWRRVVRVAQANLSDLADRASNIGRGERSLEEMSDAELERELERRRKEHATRGAEAEAEEKAEKTSAEKPRRRRASSAADEATAFLDLSPKERRKIRQYYANLELPFGASLDEVKKSYRRLMRQYHPDKHQDDPARRKLATQLSQKLTRAYNELNQLLKKRKK
jgi:hypothetical protein